MTHPGISSLIQKTELTWAVVNTADPSEMAEFDEQEERKAGEHKGGV
jgi:hypothetical protein